MMEDDEKCPYKGACEWYRHPANGFDCDNPGFYECDLYQANYQLDLKKWCWWENDDED